MDKNNLSKEQQQLLENQRGVAAAIMGYLVATEGKVVLSRFNKLIAELGFGKFKRDSLLKLKEELEINKDLEVIYDLAYERELKLDDLKNRVGSKGDLKETTVYDVVTPAVVDKQKDNARMREFNKLQREGAYLKVLMEDLKKDLSEEYRGMPRAKYLQTPVRVPQKGDKTLILCVSDWHIGAIVYNKETGGYDYEKLVGSMQKVLQEALQLIEDFDIDHVYMFNVGDSIEHINMRKVNQAFESEFRATEQISKAIRLTVDMLTVLSERVHVTFGIVGGNHDRFQGDKNEKIYGDNVAFIILDQLFMIQEVFGQIPNVTLIDNREDIYDIEIEIAGLLVHVKHGDNEAKKTDVKIPKLIKNRPIDLLIMAHIHTTRIIQEDYARYHAYCGSPMGGNNYAKENNLPTTSGAQLAMVLTEGSKNILFAPLILDNKEDI